MANMEFQQAVRNGLAFYVAPEPDVDIDVNDTCLLCRNTTDNYTMYVQKYTLESDVATKVTIHRTSDATTALAGTAVTVRPLGSNTANTTYIEAKGDETGLSQGTVIEVPYLEADVIREFLVEGGIEIGHGQGIGFDWVTEPTKTRVELWVYLVRR